MIPEFDDEENEEEDELASTIQSNREANVRTSSWSLFGRKRKLSSSIDSFNSETMVELGLADETELPKLQPNTSWSFFLISEGHGGGVASGHGPSVGSCLKSKGASVWPREKAVENARYQGELACFDRLIR